MIAPAYTDITGLAGVATTLAAALFTIPALRLISRPRKAALFLTVLSLVLIPFGALSVASCVRGLLGDLSITTLILLVGSVSAKLPGRWPGDQSARLALLTLISAAALALYPMALGVGMFDPYRLGYGSPWFVGVLFVIALAAWFTRLELISICIATATLAWADDASAPLVAERADGGLVLRGGKRFVLDGHTATWLLVEARDAELARSLAERLVESVAA